MTHVLATYLPEGAPFVFADDHPLGDHPWSGRPAWQGHGVLMLQRPGESYAVWHFWDGPDREFAGWYLNIQEPFRRTTLGYDTQDLELDVWAPAEGGWVLKDDDLLDVRVSGGTVHRHRSRGDQGDRCDDHVRSRRGRPLVGRLDGLGARSSLVAVRPPPDWSTRAPVESRRASRRARVARAAAAAARAPTSSTRRAAPSGSARGAPG